jgi:DNA modification methylase
MELNKIYCGDCAEILKQIPDKSIDLILTDPPYKLHAGRAERKYQAE